MEGRLNYKEAPYWESRVEPVPEIPWWVTKRDIAYINKHIGHAETILDFGPGVGRTFVAYAGISQVIGCDISQRYYKEAKETAKKYRLNYQHITVGVGRLPFYDKAFDVVITGAVLLHQRPQNLLLVMSELARVGRHIIVISAQDKEMPFVSLSSTEPTSEHCFNYDYEKICKDAEWDISDIIRLDGQIYFTYRERKCLQVIH